MKPLWQPAWFESAVAPRSTELWRGVEAQHVIATMRLVDSVAEQQVLEQLLETSKPPLPPTTAGQHYLLSTPYRYRPPQGTRFTRPGSPGIWYGSEEQETACAEVAYWRWCFLTDSDALADAALHTEHTFFQARVTGKCVDLCAPPWNAKSMLWQHKSDYSACRTLADAARDRAVDWIRYFSVRRTSGHCGAVLAPVALALRRHSTQQTWACKTTRAGAYIQHTGGSQRYEFSAGGWL